MKLPTDFDNLQSKALFDIEQTSLFGGPMIAQAFVSVDFQTHRRERIDSEDFILPVRRSYYNDTDIFVTEFSAPRNAEDSGRRRRSSMPVDGKLLELEVRSLEVHFRSFETSRLSPSQVLEAPAQEDRTGRFRPSLGRGGGVEGVGRQSFTFRVDAPK